MIQKIISKLNDLRPKQLLILAGIAAVLMFGAIFAGVNALTGKEVVVEPDFTPLKTETKAVVVAKVNIPARTRIKEEMLQIKEIPVDLITGGEPITSIDSVKDVQVKVSIFAGDILTVQKIFVDKSEEGFVAAIPPNCRAISINVNSVTGVSGFAKPGDKVDLLLIEKSNYSVTTNVLLQNVLLLSVNQQVAGDETVGDSIANPSIATLALPPQDVLKLISAAKLGEIYMMLRPAKASYVAEMEYTIDSINKPQPAPEPEPTPIIPQNPVPATLPQIPAATVPAVPMAPATPKIDIIQGDELTQKSETAQIQNFAATNSTSALPAIPSRSSSQEFTAPPPPDVPLSNSPIMNQIGH